MEYTISLGDVSMSVKKKGAELTSLTFKGQEFMWEADPTYWGKSSPVLFPFIGGLMNDTYTFQGQSYAGKKHGFARDQDFELKEQTEGSLIFGLSSNEESLKHFPFHFDLYLIYQLRESGLDMRYKVFNKGESTMYFSVGGHPAFATPVSEDIQLSDYYLEFAQEEQAKSILLEGLLASHQDFYPLEGKVIALDEHIFDQDALMFEGLKSQEVSLKCKKNSREVKVNYAGFPYIAFWAKPGAPYVCIEPWCGIADYVDSNGKLEEKIGIQSLESQKEFAVTMGIQLTV